MGSWSALENIPLDFLTVVEDEDDDEYDELLDPELYPGDPPLIIRDPPLTDPEDPLRTIVDP